MSPQLGLLLGFLFIAWSFYRDRRWRRLPSRALWIPGIWLAIISSRQLSFWLYHAGIGGGTSDNLEGNSINAAFNVSLFIAAVLVLRRRRFRWGYFASVNKALVLIYVFLLCSMLWSAFPIPTVKRWIIDFGCVLTGLVILTEKDPGASLRVVFVRVSYVLFPLSVVFIRYFPQIGRNVSSSSGAHILSGVADHKNSLGLMTMLLCLVLLWDLMETRKRDAVAPVEPESLARGVNLAIGLYLLVICDSATALACFVFGVTLLFAGRRLARMENARQVIMTGVAVVACAALLDQVLAISDTILGTLGRDATLTGRTDIWGVILEKNTNHLIGAGFRGFWETSIGESVSRELGSNRLLTAHNGYLEVYLYGGFAALILLGILIWATGLIAVDKLVRGDSLGRIAVVFWPILLIYNVSESAFFLTGPLWFTTLLVTIDSPWQQSGVSASLPGSSDAVRRGRTRPTPRRVALPQRVRLAAFHSPSAQPGVVAHRRPNTERLFRNRDA